MTIPPSGMCWKVKHPTRSDAQDHLKAIKRVHDPRYDGHVYHCPICDSYHIGRMLVRKPGRRRKS